MEKNVGPTISGLGVKGQNTCKLLFRVLFRVYGMEKKMETNIQELGKGKEHGNCDSGFVSGLEMESII